MRLTLFRCFLRSYRLSRGGKVPFLKQNGSIAAAISYFYIVLAKFVPIFLFGYFSIWKDSSTLLGADLALADISLATCLICD